MRISQEDILRLCAYSMASDVNFIVCCAYIMPPEPVHHLPRLQHGLRSQFIICRAYSMASSANFIIRSACPRWLMAFFCSGEISAEVLPYWGRKKMGSYPKPFSPAGA